MSDRCAAFARSGERCRRAASGGSKYCSSHKESYEKIEAIYVRHKDHFIGFVIGALTETAVDDAYEDLKRAIFGTGSREVTPADFQTILNRLAFPLHAVMVDGDAYRIQYFLASKPPAEPAIYECWTPVGPDLKEEADYNKILVHWIDAGGSRKIGRTERGNLSIDLETTPPQLVLTKYQGSRPVAEHRFRMRGSRGKERLERMSEMYFLGADMLRQSGDLGPLHWEKP